MAVGAFDVPDSVNWMRVAAAVEGGVWPALAAFLSLMFSMNLLLCTFNLIPLPPLDGSKVVESFLSFEAARKYEAVAKYSFFILMALLLTGALNVLSYPIHFCTKMTISLMAQLFHIPGI